MGFVQHPKIKQQMKKSFRVWFICFIDQDLCGLDNPNSSAKQEVFELNDESVSCLVENVIGSICLIRTN